MSKNHQQKQSTTRRRGRDRHIRIRSDLRTTPDLHKIAGTVVAIALAQAEKDAQAQRERQKNDDTGVNS